MGKLTTGLQAELVELRLRAWRHFPEYHRDDGARHALRQQLAGRFGKEGSIETYRHGGALAAAVMVSAPRESSFTGLQQVLCVVDYDPADSAAQRWCAEVLKPMVSQFDERHTIELDAAHHLLLPKLLQLGMAIDSLQLHGDPKLALARLGPIDAAARLEQAELSIAPLSSSQQVEQILALRGSYFAAHPEHAPGDPSTKIDAARQAEIDAFVRDKLAMQVSVDPPTHFVFLRDGELLGSFGLTVDRGNPLLGFSAGVEIALAPSIHGLGLGALAYQKLLTLMVELEVDVFKGMTSNPAVIHLARKMRRPLRGWHLCRTPKDLPPDHFDYPIDL